MVNCDLDTYSAGLLLDAVAYIVLYDNTIPQLRLIKGMEDICLPPLLVYYSLVIFVFFSK